MLRQTLSLVVLMLISLFSLGLQSAGHAQTVGGIFKASTDISLTLKINAYYDATGAPAGSFYIGNSAWNFSGGYQYTTLGCGIGFGYDLRGNAISSAGNCYGTLYNFFYAGSRTKVMAHTNFSSVLGLNSYSVSLIDYTTHNTITTYSGYVNTTIGWMSLTN